MPRHRWHIVQPSKQGTSTVTSTRAVYIHRSIENTPFKDMYICKKNAVWSKFLLICDEVSSCLLRK